MKIVSIFQNAVAQAVERLYGEPVDLNKVQVNPTPPDFTGDYSVVIFPFVKLAKKAPDVVAAEIGSFLQERLPQVKVYNVVKGFLNLEIVDAFWLDFLQSVVMNP
ncbi:MAG: arginine--tRNA ligase, partial [Saprospiraceae bacterium]